jgi:hypothetical protein
VWESDTQLQLNFTHLQRKQRRDHSFSQQRKQWHCFNKNIQVHLNWKVAEIRSRYSDWLQAGRPRSLRSSLGRVKNFRCKSSSRPTLGPTQPPLVTGSSFPGGKPAGVWSWPFTFS